MQSTCYDGIQRAIRRNQTRFKVNNRLGPSRIIKVQVHPSPISAPSLAPTPNPHERVEVPSGITNSHTCPRCYFKFGLAEENENDVNVPTPEQNSRELHMSVYFHVMYTMGMSLKTPYTIRSRRRWTKPIFILIALLTILHSAMIVKRSFLSDKTAIENCIQSGHALVLALYNLSCIVIAWKNQQRIGRLIYILKDIGRLFTKCDNKNEVYITVCAIVGLGLSRTLTFAIQSDLYWDKWSLESAVRSRASDVVEFMFIWKKVQTNWTEAVLDQYTSDFNPASILMAIISLSIETAGTLFENVNKGFIIATAMTMMYASVEFEEGLSKTTANSKTTIPKRIWQMYKSLQLLSDEINAIYASVLSFFHGEGFLIGAYFLYNCTQLDVYNGDVFYYLVDVVRTAVLHMILSEASNSNETFQKWIRGRFMAGNIVNIQDSNDSFLPSILIEELNTQPIGIKCNTFLINTTFSLQCAGMVVHFFLLLVDAAGN